MAYTKHGHHIPGSPVEVLPESKAVYRCGGIGLCDICKKDVFEYESTNTPKSFSPLQLTVYEYAGKCHEVYENRTEGSHTWSGILFEFLNAVHALERAKKVVYRDSSGV